MKRFVEGEDRLQGALLRHRQLVASGQLNLRQQRWNQSSLQTDTADFGPDLEFLGPGGSVLGGSDMITAKMEQVVDLIADSPLEGAVFESSVPERWLRFRDVSIVHLKVRFR